MYDGRIGRWLSTDPKGQFASPYEGMGNNPVTRNDPTGGVSPIYDQDGNFLGTDDQGLKGAAIIMDATKFTQGMSHEAAQSLNLGLSSLSENASFAESTHFNNLKSRPDYDGFVTISEGVAWAKAHPGALSDPTPDNTLYLDASKLDFGNITTSDFSKLNSKTPINLLNTGNFVASMLNPTLRGTVYALGRVDMELLNRNTGSVKIINNSATDYDWNGGGGFVRNTLIQIETSRAGLNDSDGFKTYYYGTGHLNMFVPGPVLQPINTPYGMP